MTSALLALVCMVVYLLLLFAVAHYADRKREIGESIVSNPYVYALSLSVYCTAWTFYGSIGRAASTGLGFLPIYIGPTLVMLTGWFIIRKMIRISKEHRLTSISDFISFRYGRSYAIGSLVTILSLVVITPYIALQLIAITSSMNVIGGGQDLGVESKMSVAALLGLFAIIFGARHLDPMERHEGLIAAIAFESIVKLVAFLVVGIYITYGIFDGYGEIMSGVIASPEYSHLLNIDYTSWFTLTMISAFSILFLPRQFHVMVVENSEERHLKRAMWLFPLYLLLINLFVPAIAGAGLLLNTPGFQDMFIISIPYLKGQELLAIFVFIGGASAATAMVLVESVAVGTMILNELEMPHLMRWIGKGRDLPSLLLNMKRFNILLVIGLGYLYSRAVAYHSLVDIGLVSFVAASQLAPAAIGGLYWRKGSREGAMAGLFSGFLLWIYTALLPTMVKADWLSADLLVHGPFGIEALRPTALFGTEMDMWTHSTFWTLLVNGSLYVLFSLMSVKSPEERAQMDGFVGIYEGGRRPVPAEKREIRIGTVDELESTLARFIGPEKAGLVVKGELVRMNTSRDGIDARELLELWDRVERTLTGSLGTSAARIVEKEVSVNPVVEAARPTTPRFQLEDRRIYVVPEKAYEVFTDQITHGMEGLCITTADPEEVRSTWGFVETPIIRLNHGKGRGNRYISPTNLPLLFITIKGFVEKSKNSIILLDSLEYLIEQNRGIAPPSEVLDFAKHLEELFQEDRRKLILPIRPDYLNCKISSDVEPVSHLLLAVGPLPEYLLRVFVEAMVSGIPTQSQDAVLREIGLPPGEVAVGESDSCDPDMREGVAGPVVHRLTRRSLLATLRRAAHRIKELDPTFEIHLTLDDLLKKYGFSPYELVLVPGTTYVIEETKPIQSLEIFGDLVRRGMAGLCISRYHPEKLHERYGIEKESIIWLTQRARGGQEYRTVDPTNFPRMSTLLTEFLDRAEDPLILLEGLGYLITQSNYETVLRFIQSQRDEIALKGAILLVHIDPLALDTKEVHRLESEMEPLEV
ncbi:MAG: DUF835 domain-containing protein [Methanotrichaceae archaeon]|nr:DUF835 domain-containing protein [Methanotrichaceae archaeon]